ncbi:hypothetical protein ACFYO5_21150 [Streptomyces sp. NPDC006259]|uniref:hypothetical protein n=1 Tax=unclassified Streptomyces TaxID=2593676 RepID=UPI0033A3F4A5
MASTENRIDELTGLRADELEAVLDPAEADGIFRDSRECGTLALNSGSGTLLLSPPTPRPKKP